MIISQYKCNKCAHKIKPQNILLCALTGKPIENTEVCSHYTESPYICEICGKHLLLNDCIIEVGISAPYHTLCTSCSEAIGGCRACKYADICSFRTDSSIQEPPLIVQTIQQGNTRVQTQIKNPARIKLTCEKCDCYHGEECCKETINRCDKFQNCITGW